MAPQLNHTRLEVEEGYLALLSERLNNNQEGGDNASNFPLSKETRNRCSQKDHRRPVTRIPREESRSNSPAESTPSSSTSRL